MEKRGIKYTPKATPYHFTVPVKKEEITKVCDEVWEQHKEHLTKAAKYKGKKGKGGKVNYSQARGAVEKALGFYQVYGSELAMYGSSLIEESTDTRVMLVNTCRLQGEDTESPYLSMEVFAWPECRLSEANADLLKSLKADDLDLPSLQESLDQRIKELQEEHPIRTSAEEVTEDSEVVFDVYTSVNGERYEKGMTKLTRCRVSEITPAELKENVPGLKVDECVIVHFDEAVEGKECTVKAEVTIRGIYSLQYLDPNKDDLYIKAGFSDRESFVKSFEDQYSSYTKNAIEGHVYDTVVNFILNNAEMDPIPERFIDVSINKMLSGQQSEDPELLRYVGQQIYKQTVDMMAMSCYINVWGLSADIKHEDLLKHMVDNVSL
jgi:hypothetical protein